MMSKRKTIILRYWLPVVTTSPFSVKVEGFLCDPVSSRSDKSQPYRSSAIVTAEGPRALYSRSGTEYLLDGPADLRECKRKGFSPALLDLFEGGFPRHYEQLLREYFCPKPKPVPCDDFEDEELDATFDPFKEKREKQRRRAEREGSKESWSDSDVDVVKLKSAKKLVKVEKKAAKRRWTKKEVEDLKIALGSIIPHADNQWENVAKAVRGNRTVEECQEAAAELGWKPNNGEEEDGEENAFPLHVQAKKGTAKFEIQTDKFARNFMMNGEEEDEFENIVPQNGSQKANSLADLTMGNLDDSFMEAMRKPNPASVKRPNKRKLLQQTAFTLDDSASEDNGPHVEEPNTAEDEEDDPQHRENIQRYVHGLQKSKLNQSKRPLSKKPRRLNEDVVRQVDQLAQMEALKERNRLDEEMEDHWSSDG
ncbi:hypothetical protein L596_014053 [Steinernema carpocapsae]|uniref:Myb-like domain-containing protein n=1 Tax=Steinernema carpocapsae TaxID=34508 RepID=A0A4U5NBX5_STECR|nr:hypothetical protein L596_014053 [Steinernema carpocapsae]